MAEKKPYKPGIRKIKDGKPVEDTSKKPYKPGIRKIKKK